MYRRAGRAEKLPWHRDYPPKFLDKAIAKQAPPATALDVGCGAGSYSVFLAQAGYQVTAIDFVEQALDMARNRAKEADVSIQFQRQDALAYRPDQEFDLVLDSGCLHGFAEKVRGAYRTSLLTWLRPGGQFVLVHFNQRHALDWCPIGPRRWKRERVENFLGADFRLQDYYEETFKAPLPIGPKIKMSTYWFERS